MSYGSLVAIVGPMYAGKTTEVLKRVLWAKHGENKTVIAIKPSFDNRYSETEIVSHDGLRSVALSINAWEQAVEYVRNADLICLDEIQFFDAPHFEDDIALIIRSLMNEGKSVVVSGLDMDWQGKPFSVSALMVAMADEVLKLRANCTVCGKPAHKTYKKIINSETVELGATDLYESRCNTHWIER